MARPKKRSIYVLKLINGIDIIGTCYSTEMKSLSNTRSSGTSISIKNPLTIVMSVTNSGSTALYLQRYMYGLDNEIEINKSMIITAYPANDILTDYYNAGSTYQSEVLDHILDTELADMTTMIIESIDYMRNRDIKEYIKDNSFSKRKRKIKKPIDSDPDTDIFDDIQKEWLKKSKDDGKVH